MWLEWCGGAQAYRVEYALNINGPFYQVGATSSLSIIHSVPAPSATPVAYVYRVTCVDSGNTTVTSPPSNLDYAVTGTTIFTNEPIVPHSTPVKAAHIAELRLAIDALRAAATTSLNPLPPVWQNASPPSGVITADPFTSLVGPFNAARQVFGLAPFSYTTGIPTPASGVPIKSEHIQQIREALR